MKTFSVSTNELVPVVLSLCLLLVPKASASADWPIFRGPTGDGIVPRAADLPVEFGPSKNLAWKTDLPAGHSSPIVWDEKIFLTGSEPAKKQLEVFCLSTKTGAMLWRKEMVV